MLIVCKLDTGICNIYHEYLKYKESIKSLLFVIQPNNTFFIMYGRAGLRSSSPSVTHLAEHKYCNSGIRYFPQKSTNLTCSTRLLKNTPATDRSATTTTTTNYQLTSAVGVDTVMSRAQVVE